MVVLDRDGGIRTDAMVFGCVVGPGRGAVVALDNVERKRLGYRTLMCERLALLLGALW